MCTGRAPFRGETLTAILLQLTTHNPPAPHDLDPAVSTELSDLVMRLLSKAPADRPASAREVAEALRAIETGLPTALPALPDDPANRDDRYRARSPRRDPTRHIVVQAAAQSMDVQVHHFDYTGLLRIGGRGDVAILCRPRRASSGLYEHFRPLPCRRIQRSSKVPSTSWSSTRTIHSGRTCASTRRACCR